MTVRLIACAAALALAVGGCGGDGDGGGDDGAPRTLNVGVIPVSNVASLYLGIERGFFERERLKIKPHVSEGGAEVIPTVISGDVQIGYSNIPSLLTATDRGLPLEIVANAGGGEAKRGAPDAEIIAKVFVRKDSPIRSARDLEGKTVAVNTLENIVHITTKAALEKRGVDVDGIKFLEVPFPEMLPALEARRVDAAFLVTPFAQQAEAAGARAIMHPYYELRPGFVNTAYFASRKWAEENADVLERFVRAMDRSIDYAGKHPDEVRKILPTFTRIPLKLVDEVPLGQVDAALDAGSLRLIADIMRRYGLIERAPDLDRLVRPGTLK